MPLTSNINADHVTVTYGFIEGYVSSRIIPYYYVAIYYNSNNITAIVSLPLVAVYEDNSIGLFVDQLTANFTILAKQGIETINNILLKELKKDEITIDNYTLLPVSNSIEINDSKFDFIETVRVRYQLC